MALSFLRIPSLSVLLTFLLSIELIRAYHIDRHTPFVHRKASNNNLLPRGGDGGVGEDIKWTEWTAGDGVKDGKDADGIWFIKDAIEVYRAKYPDPNDRVGVFWAGGVTTQDDFDDIDEFIESYTSDKGKKFTDIFSINQLQDMGLSEPNKNGLWWRAINRASKSLSAAAYGSTAYVFMNNNNCRNLFSPPSQNPQDSDPDHHGQATNGEIWYYAELPTLMRNVNIKQIVTFYKTKREQRKRPRFVQDVAWDVDRDKDKPRNFLADISMDASPIILPAAAGRSPMRRDMIPRNGASSAHVHEDLSIVKIYSKNSTMVSYGTHATASPPWSSKVKPTFSSNSTRAPYQGSSLRFATQISSTRASFNGITASGIPKSPSPSSTVNHVSLSHNSGSRSGVSTANHTQGTDTKTSSISGQVPVISSSSSKGSSNPPSGKTSLVTTSTNGVQTSKQTTVTPVSTTKVPSDPTIRQTTPLITSVPITTVAPTGAQAKSSASSISSQIAVLVPVWQDFIDHPQKKKGDDLITKLKSLKQVAENFERAIGPPSPGNDKQCSVNTNLIQDIFNAAKCVTSNLEKAGDDIEEAAQKNFNDLTNVKTDLQNIQDLTEALKEDKEDDEDDKSTESQGKSSRSSEHTSSTPSSLSSSQASCTITQTASACSVLCSSAAGATAASQQCTTTCFSKLSGCSVTNEITTVSTTGTAAACPLGGGTSVPAQTQPEGPFITAWFDYGVSCTGSDCGMFASGSPGSGGGSTTRGDSGTSTVISLPSDGSLLHSSRVSTTGTMSKSDSPTSTSLEPTRHTSGHSSLQISPTSSASKSIAPATTTTPSKSSLPAATPTVPYATSGGSGAQAGKCHVHVNEFEDCENNSHNLKTEVTIWDVGGNQIGYQAATEAGATDPLSVPSKLEDPLIVTPEHRHDYVQFQLGTEKFDSRQQDQTGLAWCSTGGWDPKGGAVCDYEELYNTDSKRQMDCYFQCPYHGGKSSDGS